jgi:phosphate starvation-inducible PhoH-like protein
LVSKNKIEIAPLGFMQWRTFKNSIIIADEMQNSTPNQMFMLLTRLGLNSKMIVTGDLMQPNNKDNGLSNIIQKLDNHYDSNNEELQNNKIDINRLTSSDIQRHSIVNIITQLYKK